jgi:hypothetical protein
MPVAASLPFAARNAASPQAPVTWHARRAHPRLGLVNPTPASAAARQQVLAALRAFSRQCAAESVPDLGRPDVSGAKVLAAFAATTLGRSPGGDGVPAEL